MALATIAQVEAVSGLSISGTSLEDRAEALIELASGLVTDHLGQGVELVEDDVQTLQGLPGERLSLPSRPVVSVASAFIDGIEATDWIFESDRGSIWRENGWKDVDYEVEVTYTHGYAVVPTSLALIVARIVARALSNADNVTQQVTGPFSVTYADTEAMELTESMRATLDRFANELGGRRARHSTMQILGSP